MNILVIEDQTMVRELLVIACSHSLDGAEIRSVGSSEAAMASCELCPPDLVILDLVLPDGDGLDVVPRILEKAPKAKILALSSHLDEFTVHRALRAHVQGILDKNEQSVQTLREAILAVLSGRTFMSSLVQRLRASTREDPAAFDKILSPREQEVLGLIGKGITNESIASRLEITISTAKHHRINIMAKLGIHSTPQLIHYAIEKGFTRVSEGPIRPLR